MRKEDTPALAKKRLSEQAIVATMIKLYCRKKHKTSTLCPSCADLLQYAQQRINLCPVMENKTFCSACKIHCYKPEYRAEIKKVMKFAGPWMLLYHPVQAVKHLLNDL